MISVHDRLPIFSIRSDLSDPLWEKKIAINMICLKNDGKRSINDRLIVMFDLFLDD